MPNKMVGGNKVPLRKFAKERKEQEQLAAQSMQGQQV